MAGQRNVLWAYRNRMAQHKRVEEMCKEVKMSDMEILDAIVNCLMFQRDNGFRVLQVSHDGKSNITLELGRPGGGFEVITLAVVR